MAGRTTYLERLRLGELKYILVALLVGHKQVFDPDLPEFDQRARDL